MKKARKIQITIGALSLAAICVGLGCKKSGYNPFHVSQNEFHLSPAPEVDKNHAETANNVEDSRVHAIRKQTKLSAKETRSLQMRSLQQMVFLLRDFSTGERGRAELIATLENSGHQPLVSSQSTSETGEITLITTTNPPTGTRYFSAQYFGSGDEDSAFLQFMTFEFRPGPSAMKEAEAALRAAFPELGEASDTSITSKSWELENGYELLINEVSSEILNDPQEAGKYTSEDLGVVQLTIQLKDHEHGP